MLNHRGKNWWEPQVYFTSVLIICSLSFPPLPHEDTSRVSFTHHCIHQRQAPCLTYDFSWMDSQMNFSFIVLLSSSSFVIVLSPQLDCSHLRAETISHIPPKSFPVVFHSIQCQYWLIKLSSCEFEKIGRQED